MKQYYEETVTRIGESLNTVKVWAKGEERWGLEKSIFVCENGVVTQYCNGEEAEAFHKMVTDLNEKEFDKICEDFFEAIGNKDLVKMHEALAIFDEMDNYNIGKVDMKRRLMRIRKSTQDIPYKIKFGEKKGIKNFILYKGKVYRGNGEY